eukprot:CAMPEP_0181495200 /NCGR_PEP_ID=MMETSP1110-20121109/52238_1 /TAXON_ID=174948 /ORGANISM="Symbiodinium sp., Strain CCMP421" /LENGTH=98 /DNA_ID=CAMNT_0023622783 /DNA_START=24 /DNA_END=320 /DNA_ORIENTATION=+
MGCTQGTGPTGGVSGTSTGCESQSTTSSEASLRRVEIESLLAAKRHHRGSEPPASATAASSTSVSFMPSGRNGASLSSSKRAAALTDFHLIGHSNGRL